MSVPQYDTSLVQLVSEQGDPLGTAPRATVHTATTPLHLAFSCHLIDGEGRVLLTRRSLSKAAWPGVWTNSFCGHPAPGEPLEEAVRRRAREELGLEIDDVRAVLPDFRYRAVDSSGVVEHEICPVFVARIDRDPEPSPEEVDSWAWASPDHVDQAVTATPFVFSPWLVLQHAELGRGLWQAPEHE
ncbi:isopentenyl-diphosphate Delta-isomerase [Arthrobacter woluwensis]|uniref:isopentenyl-diphosphate Delta-isomerase n=1 Tax=Arthrobacter woluwensis TaxID=156980 RepID=UPI0037F2F438